MNQVAENRVTGPREGFASITLTRIVCILAVITLAVAFLTMSLGNGYLDSVGRGGWCGTERMWRYGQFKDASVLLIPFVIATAVLAHILRQKLGLIRRWAIFFSWGFGAAVLISYWGALRLPL